MEVDEIVRRSSLFFLARQCRELEKRDTSGIQETMFHCWASTRGLGTRPDTDDGIAQQEDVGFNPTRRPASVILHASWLVHTMSIPCLAVRQGSVSGCPTLPHHTKVVLTQSRIFVLGVLLCKRLSFGSQFKKPPSIPRRHPTFLVSPPNPCQHILLNSLHRPILPLPPPSRHLPK
ncbi:hypothetical protein VTI74DRAFT_11008 [Chaetomium olivicolor]